MKNPQLELQGIVVCRACICGCIEGYIPAPLYAAVPAPPGRGKVPTRPRRKGALHLPTGSRRKGAAGPRRTHKGVPKGVMMREDKSEGKRVMSEEYISPDKFIMNASKATDARLSTRVKDHNLTCLLLTVSPSPNKPGPLPCRLLRCRARPPGPSGPPTCPPLGPSWPALGSPVPQRHPTFIKIRG